MAFTAADTDKKNSQPVLIPSLTGLRFVLVSMLFIFHYNSPVLYGTVLSRIFNHFYVCLNVFFVLSGFLITHVYFDEIAAGKKKVFEYALNRVARIVPLYVILTCVQLGVQWYQSGAGAFPWHVFIANITLLKGLSVSFFFTGIYAAWSLTTEGVFYVLAPFIFKLIRKKVSLLLQVAILLIIAYMLALLFDIFPFYGFFDSFKFNWTVTFFGRSFEFFMGIWLALYIKKQHMQPFRTRKRNNISFTSTGLLLLAGLIIVLSIVNVRTADDTPQNIPGLLVSLYLFPMAVVVFLYGLITEQTKLRQLLDSPLLQLLGKSSYAFFLAHACVIAVFISRSVSRGNVLLLFLLMYAVSVLLYLVVEHPLNYAVKKAGWYFARRLRKDVS